MKLFSTPQMAIDFGTANCVIIKKGDGIVLQEPTVVAVSPKQKKIIATGQDAHEMLGKVSKDLIARRPLKNGGIANYRLAEALLKRFVDNSLGKFRLFKPDIIISVPAGLTSVEERAVIQALQSVGARNIYLFPEPLAAAIGAELPIHSSGGNMIVNMGGGTVEIAVISMNGIVEYASFRTSGDGITKALIDYIKDTKGVKIGERVATSIKHEVASALQEDEEKVMRVNGIHIATSRPETVVVRSNELVSAIRPILESVVKEIITVLEKTSPELVSDIMNRGIVLSGGTSLLRNIDVYFTKSLNIPTYVVENPLTRVVHGLEKSMEMLDEFELSVKRG